MKLCPIILLCLAGCSSMSETFDSVPGQGVGAKPITVVNHMVDQGQLKGSSLAGQNALSGQNVLLGAPGHQQHTAQLIALGPVGLGPVQRQSEHTMRVWIAPYVDNQGYLHESSRVHAVIKPSTWAANTQKENNHVS